MASVAGARRQVALAVGDPDPVSEPDTALAVRDANARLIAAAPSLLATLEEFAEADCSYGDDCPPFGTRHGICTSCRARAALAKLDGGTKP
jgi:hypothetical protein